DGLCGRIGSRTGDHRHAPSRGLDAKLDDLLVLVVTQRGRFAGRPARHKPVRALVDLPLDELAERGHVDFAVLEPGDQGRNRAFEGGDRQSKLLEADAALKVNGVTKSGGQ